jgi:hypothetical protein
MTISLNTFRKNQNSSNRSFLCMLRLARISIPSFFMRRILLESLGACRNWWVLLVFFLSWFDAMEGGGCLIGFYYHCSLLRNHQRLFQGQLTLKWSALIKTMLALRNSRHRTMKTSKLFVATYSLWLGRHHRLSLKSGGWTSRDFTCLMQAKEVVQ